MGANVATDPALVERRMAHYRAMTIDALLRDLPADGPAYLYDLLPDYPSRPSKGLRAALCLATCNAFGGDVARALNSAVAVELFHNAFLIHDDIQDGSEQRRGQPTLHALHGPAIALNVGNATNLIGLRRIMANRSLLGGPLSWRIITETETMLRHSLEGQAIELGWIRDNACDLVYDDYFRMCLKKTSWYTCIYPCRLGLLIASGSGADPDESTLSTLDRFGWYLGAAFQIQDDVLNLVGSYDSYGKEILGDLWEGKRTLMLIHLLQALGGADLERLQDFLGLTRATRTAAQIGWVLDQLIEAGSIDVARQYAADLAAAASTEIESVLVSATGLEDADFLRALPAYIISRSR